MVDESNLYIIQCPECGGNLEVQAEWEGLDAVCPICGKDISIPAPTAATAPASHTKTDTTPSRRILVNTATTRLKHRHATDRKEQLRKQVLETTNLPTIPGNILAILSLLRKPDVDMRKVVEMIERDTVLVAETLKLVNSSFYSLRSQVRNISHAINLLGFNAVSHMLYSTSVMQIISPNDKLLWRHSFTTSLLVEGLIRACGANCLPANLKMTALMHDIGQVVFSTYDPIGYKNVRATRDTSQIPINEAEIKFYEVDHAESGAWLLENWQMAPEIVAPVLYHHGQEIPPCNHMETAIIQIADWIDTAVRGIPREPPNAELLAMFGLDSMGFNAWAETHSATVRAADATI